MVSGSIFGRRSFQHVKINPLLSILFSPLLRIDFMSHPLRRVLLTVARSGVLWSLALVLILGLSSIGLAQNEDSFGDAGAIL